MVDLVTGATGFIGKHLTRRLLARGRRVRALCREGSEGKLPERARIEVVDGDLRDPASLLRATQGVERVFHCAGQVSDWGADADFVAVNVEGTRALLEGACAARVARFVHFSSFTVFGVPAPAVFDDASPYGRGSDPYSRTKIEGEKVALAFQSERGLPVTVLRPTVVYGRGSTWLEEPLRMIERNAMFLLGGGEGTCHPCYVENLVDAVLLAAEHPRAVGRGYLVSDDDPVTFREYFNAVASLAGRSEIRRSIPLPLARFVASMFEATARVRHRRSRPMLTHTAIDLVCTRSRMSIQKIRDELGYRPRYRFLEAMNDLSRGPEPGRAAQGGSTRAQ